MKGGRTSLGRGDHVERRAIFIWGTGPTGGKELFRRRDESGREKRGDEQGRWEDSSGEEQWSMYCLQCIFSSLWKQG